MIFGFVFIIVINLLSALSFFSILYHNHFMALLGCLVKACLSLILLFAFSSFGLHHCALIVHASFSLSLYKAECKVLLFICHCFNFPSF